MVSKQNTKRIGHTANTMAFWESYEGHPLVKFYIVVVTIAGALLALFGALDIDFKTFLISPVVLRFIVAVTFTFTVIGIFYPIWINYLDSKAPPTSIEVVHDASFVLDAQLPATRKLRIFTSNGESAKTLFLKYLKAGGDIQSSLDVEILLRTIPGDSNRSIDLEKQIERWETDVVSAAGYSIKIAFSYYDCPVMLCGYIFDAREALLSWYARPSTGTYRSPPDPYFVRFISGNEKQETIIANAIKTFDCFFKMGQLHE